MKDIKKIFLLIICCFININFCYAVSKFSMSFSNPSDGGSGDVVPGDTDNDGMINGGWTDGSYTCSYDYGFNSGYGIEIDGFNINNESVINVKITPNELTKAGTSIGISIIEKRTASWSYEFNVKKSGECKYRITCDYESEEGYKSLETVYGSVNYHKYVTVGVAGCSWQYIDGSCGDSNVSSGTHYEKCKSDAESKAKGLAESYINSQSFENMKLLDPNDATKIGAEDDGSVTILTDKVCDSCNDGSCSCTHTYTPKSVCMNKKTSEVSYNKDLENCGDDEFKIENDVVDGVEHFHYFVPMNVTGDSFSLILSESGDRQENEWCKKAINDNPANFYDHIVGVRANGETFAFSDNITTAINSLDYGCYMRSEIRIPVSKGIYNVEDNKIKGYNLYVKNVDEDNPFPNPVTKLDSLWFDWYKSNYSGGSYGSGGSPNIRESFDGEPSYKLENVKAKQIRNLNSDLGNYLKVSLNENGASDFIRNEIVFNKVANPNTYYKLGCGPINSVETIIDGADIIANPLYQEGCK